MILHLKIPNVYLYLTENREVETKCGVRQIITIIGLCVTYAQKNV